MPLGDRLKGFREIAGLNQSELARQARIPRTIIVKVESGTQQNLTLEYARRLCRVLGVSLDLLAGSGEEEPPPRPHNGRIRCWNAHR